MVACDFFTDFMIDGFYHGPLRAELPDNSSIGEDCKREYLLSITRRPIMCGAGHLVIEMSNDLRRVYVHCAEKDLE